MDEAEKDFPEAKLYLCPKHDKVMVEASVELPPKFRSFLEQTEAVYEKYGPKDLGSE